jgi:hypothetical protein
VRQVELVGGGGTGMGQAAANISALIGLLDPGATMTADGGGLVSARLRPIEGAGQIARHLIDLAGRPGGSATRHHRDGVRIRPGGRPDHPHLGGTQPRQDQTLGDRLTAGPGRQAVIMNTR